MKAGAVEFLTKPFREQELLDAIEQALKRDRAAREEQARLAECASNYESLTPREREVMAHVVSGMLNKQIARKAEYRGKNHQVPSRSHHGKDAGGVLGGVGAHGRGSGSVAAQDLIVLD